MTPLLVLAEFRCSEEGEADLRSHLDRTLREARGVEGCLQATVWERPVERRYLFTTIWSDRDAVRRWVENEFHRTTLMPGFRRWCTEGSFGEFTLETDHDRARKCAACGRWTRGQPGWSELEPSTCRHCGRGLAADSRHAAGPVAEGRPTKP
jgi:heme-degrading monooxygenase HmoA